MPPPPGEFTIRVVEIREVDIQVAREELQVHAAPVVDAIGDLANKIGIHR